MKAAEWPAGFFDEIRIADPGFERGEQGELPGTPELARFVKEEVACGNFKNASEVHRAALTAMARKREESELRIERLRHEIQLGIDDIEAGRFVAIGTRAEMTALLDDCFEQALEEVKRTDPGFDED